jgi:phage internal scaffolding protein
MKGKKVANSRFKSAYSERRRQSLHFCKPSRTKQEFRDECDVNNILKKYKNTGLLTHMREHAGAYDDFTSFEDYHSSMNKLLEAQEAFDALPATLRKKFNNDPGQFIEFVTNKDNLEEMRDLGLAKPSRSVEKSSVRSFDKVSKKSEDNSSDE